MFDIGVNLTSSQFSRDHDEVVARALAAGVNGMLLTGTNLAESQQAQKLASRYSGCWSTAGVHPHDGSSWTPAVAEAIYTLAGEPQVVAIGECGLDFNRNFSTPHEQEVAFSAQLALAAELSMPVFLHCRDAHDRFLTLLKPWLEKIPGAVLHCFTGSRSEVQECLDLGLFIGITGWVCDERRGLELRELLPAIPAERLLLETMRGIQALFVRRDEVEEAWKWVDSITEAWAADRDAPKPYQAGTWGPVASAAMITRDGRSWNEFE